MNRTHFISFHYIAFSLYCGGNFCVENGWRVVIIVPLAKWFSSFFHIKVCYLFGFWATEPPFDEISRTLHMTVQRFGLLRLSEGTVIQMLGALYYHLSLSISRSILSPTFVELNPKPLNLICLLFYYSETLLFYFFTFKYLQIANINLHLVSLQISYLNYLKLFFKIVKIEL